MNDHLKKLEDQCWTQTPCDFDMMVDGLSTVRTVFDREKFAKLIIQECIDVHATTYGIDIIGEALKLHFGVNE